jgi:hypothetical protein
MQQKRELKTALTTRHDSCIAPEESSKSFKMFMYFSIISSVVVDGLRLTTCRFSFAVGGRSIAATSVMESSDVTLASESIGNPSSFVLSLGAGAERLSAERGGGPGKSCLVPLRTRSDMTEDLARSVLRADNGTSDRTRLPSISKEREESLNSESSCSYESATLSPKY